MNDIKRERKCFGREGVFESQENLGVLNHSMKDQKHQLNIL